jgi:hypothetical protein
MMKSVGPVLTSCVAVGLTTPRSRATTPASLPTVRTTLSLLADADGDPSNVDRYVCAVTRDELPDCLLALSGERERERRVGAKDLRVQRLLTPLLIAEVEGDERETH